MEGENLAWLCGPIWPRVEALGVEGLGPGLCPWVLVLETLAQVRKGPGKAAFLTSGQLKATCLLEGHPAKGQPCVLCGAEGGVGWPGAQPT